MEGQFWKFAFFILFIIWFCIRIPFGKESLKNKTKTKKRMGLDTFLLLLNFISMGFLPVFVVFSKRLDFAYMSLPSSVRWLALTAYGLNLVFFLWCHWSLGKNWSNHLEIKDKHRLVQEGPYKRIRHPMYTHFWLLIVSQGLILDNWIVLIFGVLSWGLLYFIRVKKEEEMLIEEFGNKYRNYMEKTGRLFPKFR